MRTRFLILIVLSVCALTASCGHVEETVLSGLMSSYLRAQEALAADDVEAATLALREVSRNADGPLKEIALGAAAESDIEAVRNQFIALSSEVKKLELPADAVVAFCPMANDGEGASWVQRKGEISNPYFGEKMLRCGTVEESGQ
jgi:hypothetical protein